MRAKNNKELRTQSNLKIYQKMLGTPYLRNYYAQK